MSTEKPLSSHEAADGGSATPRPPPTELQGQEEEVAAARRTPLERTADMAEELYRLRDTFFPRDPAEKTAALRTHADAALALLNALPPEQRKSPQQRGVYEFLRGKILDVFPEYHKEAEDHLSKAVKLNPSLVDGWLYLGNCIWKKGDLAAAKNCFSLALSKGSDKKILSQLSMLERSMAQGCEDKALLVEDSVRHAKEAVMMDITDGNSWYNLGNAYLTSFFVGGAWDHTKLHNSVKAYQNADKDKSMDSNPDLYYNFATADKYLENYERALCGFEAAALKDPGLGADTEVLKIISLLDKLDNAMKGHLRSKRLASLVSSLSYVKLKTSHKKATIRILSEGLNKTVAILGQILLFIRHDNITPLYYLTCDMDQSYFILSVYGLQNDAIKEGDRVVLFEPYYKILDTSWKDKAGVVRLGCGRHGPCVGYIGGPQRRPQQSLRGKTPYEAWKGRKPSHYQFKSIRVDFPEQILINEKAPAPHYVVRASIQAHNKQ